MLHAETIDGTPRLAVDRCGDSGPLVIFLHGIGGQRSNWTQQLAALSPGFTAVAWDARGYGDSEDYGSALDFGDFSADLLRVMTYYGAQQCHLVGLSMGGRIALDFYGRHPQRVLSLVLADTSVNSGDAVDPAKIEEFLALRLAPLQNGKEPADIAPQVVESLVGLNTPPAVRATLQESLASLHKESYMKTLACVTRYQGFPAFEAVAVPTLVVAGREDKIARPEIVEAMAAGIPGSELVWIENAGHVSNVEQPAAFNAALLDFLARN
tara:strand:- start:141480 stop:142283 length:804 start_codon:yes stop_codon:yes gene_type:complete